MTAFRARDRATQEVVLAAADCTEAEFRDALALKYGDDWVYGTHGVPPRFTIELFSVPDNATRSEIVAALQQGLELVTQAD